MVISRYTSIEGGGINFCNIFGGRVISDAWLALDISRGGGFRISSLYIEGGWASS